MAQQQVERPRQPGRRRLVAGEQQRHQLVADLARRPSARRPRSAPRSAATGCPRPARRAARRSPRRAARRSPAAAPAASRAGRARRSGARAARRTAGPPTTCPPAAPPGARPAARAAPASVDAEHRAQDHLERDRLHARVQRERLARRPAVDLARDDLAHRRLVRAHALAMERRQHQLAAREVLAALEQQQRARAHDRLQRDACGRAAACGRARCRAPGSPRGRRASPSASGSRGSVTLNASPKRRRQDSRNEIGRSSQRRVCTTGGSDGPGGSALMRVLSHRCARASGQRPSTTRGPPPGRPPPARRGAVLRLQRAIGNRATTRLLMRESPRCSTEGRAVKTDARVERQDRPAGSRPRWRRARSSSRYPQGQVPEVADHQGLRHPQRRGRLQQAAKAMTRQHGADDEEPARRGLRRHRRLLRPRRPPHPRPLALEVRPRRPRVDAQGRPARGSTASGTTSSTRASRSTSPTGCWSSTASNVVTDHEYKDQLACAKKLVALTDWQTVAKALLPQRRRAARGRDEEARARTSGRCGAT